MTNPQIDIAALIVKHLKNGLPDDERQVLEQWRSASERNEALFNALTNEEQLTTDMMQVLEIDREAARKKIMSLEFPGRAPLVRIGWWKYVAAAIVLMLLLAGVFYFITDRSNTPVVTQGKNEPGKNDIAPGGNKAVLTLSNNKQIILDNAQNGLLTREGTATINKQDGILNYERSQANSKNLEILYNILSTPKGGQFQVVLPDGSKVWLNAASSIRYPVAFATNERRVELTGEGYFEIAKDNTKPFKVKVVRDAGREEGCEIEVTGTHFNVNAYGDEPLIQATLVEGAVTIKRPNAIKKLQPGQACQVTPSGGLNLVDKPNINEVIAWKNGSFYFDHASIQTVMRQIARWYDVEVSYKDNIQQQFNGEIPRQAPVSAVFEILQSTGWVHFRIDGRKIIVMQ